MTKISQLSDLGSALSLQDALPLNTPGDAVTPNKKVTVSGLSTYIATRPGFKDQIGIACSDETTSLTTGVAKVTLRVPYAMTLTAVRLNVNTAPTGSALVVNVKLNGTTIFSTKPQIDAATKTSVGSSVTAVLSTTALTDDGELTIDIDQIGSTVAGKGLKVWLIGTRA